MGRAERLITENLGLWSAAVKTKSSAGRGSNKKLELYGISKLRELILDLAVRGMLVQQDQNDEPASKYLERIAAAKIKLLEDKKIKKQRPLAKIETGSMEFHLPRGWQWERLGNLVEMYNGRAFKSTEWRTEGLPIVRIQNLNDNKADFNYFQGELSDSNRIANGSFLISWSGTPGTSFGAFIWERGPAALNQHINKCEFHSDEVNLDFMRLAVNGQMNHFISKAQGGVGLKHVTKGTLNNAILGIPPLAEQHRIVAKSDELIALCDQLEEEQENNLETHETLVSTLLNALTAASADASQFADAWQRIQDNFDILFKTESSVDQLKQTILQLALMGKLVKQQESIDASSTDHSVAISTEEAPYTKPIGWEWKKIGDHVKIKGGSQPNKNTFINEPRDGYTRLIQIRDFKSDNFKTYIPTELANRPFTKEDVMIGRYGPPVFQILRGLEGSYNVALMKAKPDTKFINNDYLFYLLQEPRIQKIIIDESERTAGQSGIRLPLLNSIKYGLPPLGEQHLIVSKIEKLIALCDQLKESLVVAQATQLNLADSIVEQAIQSTA